jgi:hypothetical protein
MQKIVGSSLLGVFSISVPKRQLMYCQMEHSDISFIVLFQQVSHLHPRWCKCQINHLLRRKWITVHILYITKLKFFFFLKGYRKRLKSVDNKFKYATKKLLWLLVLRKYGLDPGSGKKLIPHPGSKSRGQKKHRDPGTGPAILDNTRFVDSVPDLGGPESVYPFGSR